jgi:hypothetical protein
MFRGCVHSGAFFTTWRPDNCTICNCLDKREVCTMIQCSPPQCYGFPIVTRPGKCCPECDYGISATECGAVPVSIKSLYVSLGDSSCQRDVVLRGCNKNLFVENRAWFRCEPVREKVTQSVAELPGCEGQISHVTYTTVTRCEKRQLNYYEIPQDYDPEPHRCYYYVDPQTVVVDPDTTSEEKTETPNEQNTEGVPETTSEPSTPGPDPPKKIKSRRQKS